MSDGSSSWLERAGKFFYKKRAEVPQAEQVFNKELFANAEVKFDEEKITLTRSVELGLYNDVLEWVDRRLRQIFPNDPSYKRRLMTDEKTLNAQGDIPVEKPDFVRAREAVELRKVSDLKAEKIDDVDKALRIVGVLGRAENVAEQYIRNQFNVEVHFPNLDEATSSRIVELKGVRDPRDKENNKLLEDNPLIIYLGGWGNDPRSEAPMFLEIALAGFDVYGLAYFDAQTGVAREKVAGQVAAAPGMDVHAEHMKAVVRELIAKNPGRKVQLWGHSTGSLVWATALADKEFAQEIDGAVLIHPAGAVEVANQATEYIGEGVTLAKRLQRAPLYNFVVGVKDRVGIPVKPEEVEQIKKLRGAIWAEVASRTNKRSRVYDEAHVKDGGKVHYYVGGKDTTTKAYERFGDNFEAGEVIMDPEGIHQDVNTLPDAVVKRILEFFR